MLKVEKEDVVKKSKQKEDLVQIVVLDTYKQRGSKNRPKILGRTNKEWIVSAVEKYPYFVLQYEGVENFLEWILPYISDHKFTIILSTNTPLITSQTINNIVEFVTVKNINAAKLSSGYVFNSQYIKNTKEIVFDSVYTHDEEDFYIVETKQQQVFAQNIFKNRINYFHIENGVTIEKPDSVLIEPDVFIGKDVVVCANNIIKGRTIIQDDVILKENNVISNSIVGRGSALVRSSVENSRVGNNVYINSFSNITNGAEVLDNCVIGSHCEINGIEVLENTHLPSGTILTSEKN